MSKVPLVERDPAKARRIAIGLVTVGTLLNAAAHLLMKSGTSGASPDNPLALLFYIFQNPKLFAGYSLYGLFTVVLTVALKYGELSILYPLIAVGYVWVTILSIVLYQETVNPWKIAGLVTVVAGVAIIGRASRK